MFFQIQNRYQYGREVDWWSVGLVMYNMMLGMYHYSVFVHPVLYPPYLSQEAVSILRSVSTN
jgi:serine/threonine protein kinase